MEDSADEGVFVGTNIDDDDSPGIQDRSTPGASSHNDMIEMRIDVHPHSSTSLLASVKLQRAGGDGEARIFRHDGGSNYTEVTNTLDLTQDIHANDGTLTVYCEGVQVGHAIYELEVEFSSGFTCTDRVLVHVLEFEWIELSVQPGTLDASGVSITALGVNDGVGDPVPPMPTSEYGGTMGGYPDSFGAPGSEGGFAGPPEGSGFDVLQEPFHVCDTKFTTVEQGEEAANAMLLRMEATTCEYTEEYTLLETPHTAGLFVDENDKLAIRVFEYHPEAMQSQVSASFELSSTIFGRLEILDVKKVKDKETFASEHVEINLSGVNAGDADQADTIQAELASSLTGSHEALLTETGPNTNAYKSENGALSVKIVREHTNPETGRRDLTVSVSSTQLDIAGRLVDAMETEAASGRFSTSAISSDVQEPDITDASTSSSTSSSISASSAIGAGNWWKPRCDISPSPSGGSYKLDVLIRLCPDGGSGDPVPLDTNHVMQAHQQHSGSITTNGTTVRIKPIGLASDQDPDDGQYWYPVQNGGYYVVCEPDDIIEVVSKANPDNEPIARFKVVQNS